MASDNPTKKQIEFIEEYLKTFNATHAYKTIYQMPGKTMSDNQAAVGSCRMLRNDKVKNYLERRLEERKKQTELDVSFLVKYLIGALATNPTMAYSKKSDKKYMTEVTLKSTVNLSKIGGKIDLHALEPKVFPERIKTFSKEKAAEILAKYLDMDRTHLSAVVHNKSDPEKLDNLTKEELAQLVALTKKADSVQD